MSISATEETMNNLQDDAEYTRLLTLRRRAIDAGHTEAALAYGWAAIKRGDELIGKSLFGPIADSVDVLLSAAPKQG
jgi:hypothetical protein